MSAFEYYTTGPEGSQAEYGGSWEGYDLDPEMLEHLGIDVAAANYVQQIKERSEDAYSGRKRRMMDFLHHYLNRPRERKRADQSNIPLSLGQESVDAHHHAFMNQFATLKQHPCRVDPLPINPSDSDKRLARLIDAKLYIDNVVMDLSLIHI